MRNKPYLFTIIVLICFVSSLPLSSCKKDGQESFEKSNTALALNADEKMVSLGKVLFEGKGNCIACHQVSQKVIGPSVQEIAKIYKEQNGNIVLFLKEEAEPIVDPSKYELMKTNFAITEEMDEEELLALASYIYSTTK